MTLCSFYLAEWIPPIDIKSLQNRLLKVCYVPVISASLSRLLFLSFLQWPLTVLMKQTRQAVRAFKQSILLRCQCPHHKLGRERETSLSLYANYP